MYNIGNIIYKNLNRIHIHSIVMKLKLRKRDRKIRDARAEKIRKKHETEREKLLNLHGLNYDWLDLVYRQAHELSYLYEKDDITYDMNDIGRV